VGHKETVHFPLFFLFFPGPFIHSLEVIKRLGKVTGSSVSQRTFYVEVTARSRLPMTWPAESTCGWCSTKLLGGLLFWRCASGKSPQYFFCAVIRIWSYEAMQL